MKSLVTLKSETTLSVHRSRAKRGQRKGRQQNSALHVCCGIVESDSVVESGMYETWSDNEMSEVIRAACAKERRKRDDGLRKES